MNRKIWKALGIAVCMLALAAPRAMAVTYEVGEDAPFIKFGDAVDKINKSGDEENEIILMQNITLEGEHTLERNTTIKGKEGEDHTISIKGEKTGITVTGEKTVLNLGANGYDGTLTIDGNIRDGSASENTRVAFITVSGGATANMYGNVTLQNRKSTDNACIVIMGPKSVFNMHGGVIEKCNGAVIADSGATFHMLSGEIKDCWVNGDGVISVNDGSKFIMEGGTISGCSAADDGGGLYAKNKSTITINNGTISECRAAKKNGGGLYADNSTINIEGGTISGCTAVFGNGGGLYAKNSSTITISDGTISGSTISGCEAGTGGGLYADKSTVTINNGTISGCEANAGAGGGLCVVGSTLNIKKGGTISRCKAWSSKKGNGGGLYADSSTINISDGTISGCDGRWGGGLYAEKSSTITITDSTISRCEAGAGGGLFVDSSTIRISGGIISGCTTSGTGNGGGLCANNSTIKITGGRIENNKAALGGGVALIGKTTFEKPITNWTVIGNEAYATGGVGGGIKLENGSMDVSDGLNRIYNNTAGGHGADICLEKGASITLPDAAGMGATYLKSGINIDGWYNDNPRYTPSESGQAEKKLQLSGPLSLVASYTVIPVRIEIDANGGAGGSGSQTVHKGTTVTLEAPTKEGHLFKGWEDKEKGNSYPAGEDGKVNITVNENMKLRAVWEARSFTVTYVLLNGETRTETAAYGQTVTLGEEPRTGYTFVGWKDGEKVYRAGETITVTGDMTLTAVWKARTFTVTYVLLNGETRTETAAYGQKVTLGEEPRTGYTFVGWKDGEKMYHAGETITVTGDMTLTAEWKKLPSAENLPKTGDESPVLLWGAALAVSAAACFVLRRKK